MLGAVIPAPFAIPETTTLFPPREHLAIETLVKRSVVKIASAARGMELAESWEAAFLIPVQIF